MDEISGADSGNGWIGVDLDGTLAHYDKWRGVKHIGQPIPAMVDRVKRWLAEGRDVRILTARAAATNPIVWEETMDAISAWCMSHIGELLQVTHEKDWDMLELWDDRAVQVEANTGRLLGRSTRGLGD